MVVLGCVARWIPRARDSYKLMCLKVLTAITVGVDLAPLVVVRRVTR